MISLAFVKIMIISQAFRQGNYQNYVKMHVKLFSNFTDHHLIDRLIKGFFKVSSLTIIFMDVNVQNMLTCVTM